MALTLPAGCYRQPTETDAKDERGLPRKNVVIKGPIDAIDRLYDAARPGDIIVEGYQMITASRSLVSGAAVVTFTCGPVAPTIGEGDAAEDVPLAETWTLRSVRNDKSILAYCGPSASHPSRAHIEAWQREPDGELADRYAYTKSDGSVHEIEGGATKDVIDKIRAGIDAVMRFYPMLTRTRSYTRPPRKVYEHLATIDTPTIGNWAGEDGKRPACIVDKPGNLDQLIAAHTWVKCQDDLQLLADGNYSRIESWLGSAGETVDVNLYGKGNERWSMPHNNDQRS